MSTFSLILFVAGILLIASGLLFRGSLTRRLHLQARSPGTSFDPGLDENDRRHARIGWWMLMTSRALKPGLARQLAAFRVTQLLGAIFIGAAFWIQAQ